MARQKSQGSKLTAPTAPIAEATKRITFDLDAALHRRIRLHCADSGQRMSDVLRELLAERFPSW